MDHDANGLATITVDPMNRITQDAYDDNGNVTKIIYPDGTTTVYGSYNDFAEPASVTDQMGRDTTYTYDDDGNMTVRRIRSTTSRRIRIRKLSPACSPPRPPPRRSAIRAIPCQLPV